MNFDLIVGEKRISDIQKSLGSDIWPEFMQHDPVVNKYWPGLYTNFLNFQFALYEKHDTVGIANSVALNWQKSFSKLPRDGLDWAMEKANNDFKNKIKPNVLVGLQILINPKYRCYGISHEMLGIMKRLANSKGLGHIALPVRPTLKSDYPLVNIDDYILWKNSEGLPFDPWIRVHIKAGGEIVGVCDKSMSISGTVNEWVKWTGMTFPGSGNFIVEKALTSVAIDKKSNTGTYIEPNVWIVHKTKNSNDMYFDSYRITHI